MEVINQPIINETFKPLKKKKKKNVCPYVNNEEKCNDRIIKKYITLKNMER